MATINFTNNADVVDAYNYGNGTVNHTYNLLKGEDEFHGYSARDSVHGGDGADTIFGGDGNDTLYGDTGYDHLDGGYGDDTIYGGDGNDFIAGDNESGYGSDTIYGGDGNDAIIGWNDSTRDVIFGGNGNDRICIDGDKVSGNSGNDFISVSMYTGNEHADLTLGIGSDSVSLDIHEHGEPNHNENRIDIWDFKAQDRLNFNTAHNETEYFDNDTENNALLLDRLDVNNDGWLGAKDVEAVDYDGFSVHVGKNFLELEVFDTSVFLHGMTKASFDFLA